ncbi:MAG: TetR/AcrR family transcriptional regulator [Kofleriaceae bacterium]
MPRDPLKPIPPPAPTRADARDIVEAILAAAAEVASPAVTTNQIAARAGVGIASLYRYFPNRAAIFAELSRRMHQAFRVELDAILARPDLTLAARIRACCTAAVESQGASRELRRCLNLLVPYSWSEDSAGDMYAETISATVAWLERHLPTAPPDLTERVFAAIAAVRGIIVMAMLHPAWAPDDERLIELAVAATRPFLDDLIRADAAAAAPPVEDP